MEDGNAIINAIKKVVRQMIKRWYQDKKKL